MTRAPSRSSLSQQDRPCSCRRDGPRTPAPNGFPCRRICTGRCHHGKTNGTQELVVPVWVVVGLHRHRHHPKG